MSRTYTFPSVVGNFIDGQWRTQGSERLPVFNPATEAQIAEVVEADAAQVAQAVVAAQAAHQRGEWRRMPAAQRQRLFRRIAELTLTHLEELAWLETLNTGLPMRYVRDGQMPRVARNFEFFADWMSQNVEKAGIQDDLYLRYVVREPAGVAALISPWNAPLALASTKVAAALAFGNCCVLKTAETTPLAVSRFMELLQQAGVPAGVVNLVHGRGHTTGDTLVRHPDVRVVSFTGGTETGRAIATAAGPGLKRVDLELGGKSANIVTAHADLDAALDGALTGIYSNNGQQCFAGSRILLQRSIADDFIAAFVQRAQRIRVGDPLDDANDMGPLANAAHHARVLEKIRGAVADGAQLLTGGARPAHLERGHYLAPTALLTPHNGLSICQQEVFGPVATVQVFDTFDEALAIANDSSFGLVAYLWSQHLGESLQAAQELQAGVVLTNTPMTLDTRFPFGGYKQSGVGREGIDGMRHFYTEEKTVTVALRRIPSVRLGVQAVNATP